MWGNTSKRNLHKLQLVQNFAARVILGLRKFDHISQGRRSLRWLDVTEKVLFNDLVLAYQCVNGLAPDYLGKYVDGTKGILFSRSTRIMGYLIILRILMKLIYLSGHSLIICSIRSNFGYILNDFGYILFLIKLL